MVRRSLYLICLVGAAVAVCLWLASPALFAGASHNEGEDAIRSFFDCINHRDPYGAMDLMDQATFFPSKDDRQHWRAIFNAINWVAVNKVIPDRFDEWNNRRSFYQVTFTIHPRGTPDANPDQDWHEGQNVKWFRLKMDPHGDVWRIDGFETVR